MTRQAEEPNARTSHTPGLDWYRETEERHLNAREQRLRIEQLEKQAHSRTVKRRTRRKKQKSAAKSERDAQILKIIKKGKKGLIYCKQLDANSVNVPHSWTTNGSPKTYAEAYQIPNLRHNIESEKSNIKIKNLKN